jgi:hypothetical protein
VQNPCVFCEAPASVFIDMEKSAAAAAIRGDADAYAKPCVADGSGSSLGGAQGRRADVA